MEVSQLDFYPVIHLLTGPPGLGRNGGIWKIMKSMLREVHEPPRLMVQALHFSSYSLSQVAWNDWFFPTANGNRLRSELEAVLGPQRELFVDSGGFQLLYSDKLDLSRWSVKITSQDILKLQLRYSPQRVASLDSPLPPNADNDELNRLIQFSIKNAAWLAKQMDAEKERPIPYLVVHGRNPNELEVYFNRLTKELPKDWWHRDDFGIALGSQVPLASDPGQVLENVQYALTWMEKNACSMIPLHIFGVGDNIVGALTKGSNFTRPISYDNSTYVQKAFRMRMFDSLSSGYKQFNPYEMPECECSACERLNRYGADFVSSLLSKLPYTSSRISEEKVNRSDVLGLIALHNLFWWKTRLTSPLIVREQKVNRARQEKEPAHVELEYTFPLAGYKAAAPNLLLLPCSKTRPYGASRSHRLVIARLKESGLTESKDYDRITLSGLYGPVHWKHETHPAVMNYDFSLGPLISQKHIGYLRMRTATVLNVICKNYESKVAYLRSKPYKSAFEPILQRFSIPLVDKLEHLSTSISRS